ncbi:MAG: hypothetical protein N3E37_01875 [Candidatus Micrarchaeota archaeon]|nr:hypothetical protein [Candidatus Micrarchaeota archaeon]
MRKNISMCKNIDEAIKFALELSDLEFKLLCYLCNKESNIDELSSKFKKSKIRIYQALVELMKKNIISRNKKNLRRGYEYTYSCKTYNEIKKLALLNIKKIESLLTENNIDSNQK